LKCFLFFYWLNWVLYFSLELFILGPRVQVHILWLLWNTADCKMKYRYQVPAIRKIKVEQNYITYCSYFVEALFKFFFSILGSSLAKYNSRNVKIMSQQYFFVRYLVLFIPGTFPIVYAYVLRLLYHKEYNASFRRNLADQHVIEPTREPPSRKGFHLYVYCCCFHNKNYI
jgi:hypothetical protein